MLHTELFCGLEKNNPGYAIRQAVFVHEQGFDPNLEFDEKDIASLLRIFERNLSVDR